MEEMLIEKVRQRTFLYDTKSPDYRDHHMRANAWEGIGKEVKIKRKFYVSSRDVRIVCPRLLCAGLTAGCTSVLVRKVLRRSIWTRVRGFLLKLIPSRVVNSQAITLLCRKTQLTF